MTTKWRRNKTGLCDEQGIEIREGDILKELVRHYYDRGTKDEMLSESVHIVSVAFRKGQFGILRYRWNEGGHKKQSPEGVFAKDLEGWLQSSGRHPEGGHGFQIIGNVYDNPTIIDDLLARTVIHRDVFTHEYYSEDRNRAERGETMKVSAEDAERIRQAKDGEVVELTGAPLTGPELDLAVARAIGLESALLYEGKVLITHREWDEIRGIEHTTCEGDVACIPFRPSVDLNAAFAVAEFVGSRYELERQYESIVVNNNRYLAWIEDDRRCRGAEFGPTPALAICAAILKLKEETG